MLFLNCPFLIGLRINCTNSRKSKDNLTDIYERVHFEAKKSKSKKSKLWCCKPTMCLFDYLTSKFDKPTVPEPEPRPKNAFTNELYTSPIILFKTIFSESNYSSEDYAEAKNRQFSISESYLEKKPSFCYSMPKQFRKDSFYPTVQDIQVNNMDLSKTTSSVYRYSKQESLFNVSSNTYSYNDRIFAVSKDIQAKCPGDLDLRFSDRVKLIHHNEEYSLVENIVTGQRGYAPSRYLITLNVFLNNYTD